MHNYRSIGPDYDSTLWRSNSHALEEYIDFNAYNIWVPASNFSDLTKTSGMVQVGALSMHGMSMPDAVVTELTYGFRKPRTWVNGTVSAKIWYTGDYVAGTAARMGLGVYATIEGQALASPTYSTAQLVPTPAGAFYLAVWSGFTNVVDGGCIDVSQPSGYIAITLRRQGAGAGDDYTAELILLGLEVIYKENKHTGPTYKSNPFKRQETVTNG